MAYASLLRGLVDRGLRGVHLVISDDHEGIKSAVASELPGVEWQRCVVHFERHVLSSVPASAMSEVAEDLKAIFEIGHQRTAQALAADSVFEAGIEDALTYLHYPGNHHAKLRTTNMLERLFGEVKRRTRVVAVFPTRRVRAPWPRGDRALRSSAEWALRRYLTMVTLEALEQPNPQHSRH